jgi:hypothetical protein
MHFRRPDQIGWAECSGELASGQAAQSNGLMELEVTPRLSFIWAPASHSALRHGLSPKQAWPSHLQTVDIRLSQALPPVLNRYILSGAHLLVLRPLT